MKQIAINLWFDNQAEEAANFYTSIFKDSKMLGTSLYGEGTPGEAGSVMTVTFELNGQEFVALNGGPVFTFSEATSFIIYCEDQEEVDYYWDKLIVGGPVESQQCGWLKDKYGVSWQVVPTALPGLIAGPDAAKSQKAMQAMLKMKKLDVAALQAAYDS